MAQAHQLTIADQRIATPQLQWLTLHAPQLARAARPGQYLLARCAPAGGYDPPLRRALFVAAAEEALGQVGLLYAPSERGLAWLARGRSGDQVDLLGPLGQPFALDRRTRNLLLIGQGPAVAALLLLAHQATARGCAVALLVGAEEDSALPPPFLLPGAVEYQSVIGAVSDLLLVPPETAPPPKRGRPAVPAAPPTAPLIAWADQICAALPTAQLPALVAAIRATRLRWERGFAHALLSGPLVCGFGACGVCAVETRHGLRMLCREGPVFDLRELAL